MMQPMRRSAGWQQTTVDRRHGNTPTRIEQIRRSAAQKPESCHFGPELHDAAERHLGSTPAYCTHMPCRAVLMMKPATSSHQRRRCPRAPMLSFLTTPRKLASGRGRSPRASRRLAGWRDDVGLVQGQASVPRRNDPACGVAYPPSRAPVRFGKTRSHAA